MNKYYLVFVIRNFFMNKYYSVFGIRKCFMNEYYSVFGIRKFFMNEYYSVFGIRKFFMNEYIRYSVKFTIRCNSGCDLTILYSTEYMLTICIKYKTQDYYKTVRWPQRDKKLYKIVPEWLEAQSSETVLIERKSQNC